MLLSAKADLILEQKRYKKNVFVTCDFSRIKIVFKLLIKVVALYMQAVIVLVKVSNFKNFILKSKVYLVRFLVFNKQF